MMGGIMFSRLVASTAILPRCGQLLRIENGDARKSLEVVSVKGQQVSQSMNVHDSRQAGVVDLDSSDAVCLNKAKPLGKDGRRLLGKSKKCENTTYFISGIAEREAKAVSFDRSGRRVPELHDILCGYMDLSVVRLQYSDGLLHHAVLRVVL
jgi:hypothetical protein